MHETIFETVRTPRERQIDEMARRYYDTATEAAEVLEGAMYTQIPLGHDGDDIYSLKDGTRFGDMMRNSLVDAERIADENPLLEFEIERREIEAEELPLMIDMINGNGPNTMVVVSDFPYELYGCSEDVGGYNVSRMQTMLRIITRREDGTLLLESQTLDMSDRTALETIYARFGMKPRESQLLGQRIQADLSPVEQELLRTELVRGYDNSLAETRGGKWRAGRFDDGGLNTYEFVRLQDDLIQQFILSDEYGDSMAKLGFLQILKERYEAASLFVGLGGKSQFDYLPLGGIQNAISEAARRAVEQGSVFSACGGTFKAAADIAANDYEKSGYGNRGHESKGPSDQFGPLNFSCPKGHHNVRPRGKLIDCCTTCNVSVKC